METSEAAHRKSTSTPHINAGNDDSQHKKDDNSPGRWHLIMFPFNLIILSSKIHNAVDCKYINIKTKSIKNLYFLKNSYQERPCK